jgi:ketosteroid isomerase-like protein
MASQAENVARVRAGIDAFNRGDPDAVLAVLDGDVEIFSAQALANAGTYRGHQGYLDWIGQWLEVWDGFAVVAEKIEPIGERHVVVDARQTARGKGSGVEVDMRIAYMFELDERATLALHLYASLDEAVAEAERRERETAGSD